MKILLIILLTINTFSAFAETVRMVQAAKAFLGNITDAQASVAYDDPIIEEENKVEELNLKVGDKIQFINRDEVSHNVSAKANDVVLFDVKLQDPGAKNDKLVELKTKGEFTVQCAIHPKMKIKLKVE